VEEPSAADDPREARASRSPPRLSPRPSIPPGTGPSRNYRIAIAAVWLGVQAALVLTAGQRADGAFGFRMFSESSTITLALYREVDGPAGVRTRVHVDGGVWNAHSADGVVHRLTWYDRVPTPYWAFDQETHASYGARAQLERLQAALEDVAAHVPNDAETRRFVLAVTVRRNGREPVVEELVSSERPARRAP
jgi:hypothetical protein